MKNFIIYFLFSLILFSCRKSNSVTENRPADSTAIPLPPEVGNMIIPMNDTLRYVDNLSGSIINIKKIYGASYIEPSVINDSIYYVATHTQFTAFNIYTGVELFTKFYNTLYTIGGVVPICYPVIKDSIVYITCHGESNQLVYLYAYHKKTGVKLFQSEISSNIPGREPTLTTPLISGNFIFVGYNNNTDVKPKIFCFDRFNGSLVWSKELPNSYKINPFLLIENNNLIVSISKGFGNYESIAYSLNSSNGNINWQNSYGSGELIYTEKRIKNGKLFVVTESTTISNTYTFNSLNTSNGQLNSAYDFNSREFNFIDDALYFSKDKKMYKYSYEAGIVNWSVELEIEKYRKTQNDSIAYSIFTSSPLITDQYVYILESAIKIGKTVTFLVVYNKANGALIYRSPEIKTSSQSMKFVIRDKNNSYFYMQHKR
ncbi:MAG: PQQ-binding-like beta-propeller repeat protein [Ferruginibacter sp.]|nr:PQQ-binding-like beta-propeller repeat protein [Ferruginibacter sp.]